MTETFYLLVDDNYEGDPDQRYSTEAQAITAAHKHILERGACKVIITQKIRALKRSVETDL